MKTKYGYALLSNTLFFIFALWDLIAQFSFNIKESKPQIKGL
jgi:hypothetical protein